MGWRRTVRVLFDVNFGNLREAEKRNSVRLGGLRKAFQIMQRQLCGSGKRELGNETGESGRFTFIGNGIGKKRKSEISDWQFCGNVWAGRLGRFDFWGWMSLIGYFRWFKIDNPIKKGTLWNALLIKNVKCNDEGYP